MNKIESFKGEFRFLSNFWPVGVRLSPMCEFPDRYPTVEHAYQAAKTLDPRAREVIRETGRPGLARKKGQLVTLRPAWDDIKLNVMRELLWQKFTEHPELRAKLLATEGAELVEGNTWGDTFWGVDLKTGEGENHLGKLLMETRDKIRKQQHAVLYAKRVAPELNLFEDMLKRARIQFTKGAHNGSVVFEIECDKGFTSVTFGKDGVLMSMEGHGW